MLAKQDFNSKSYEEKLRILHEVVDPIKDSAEVYQKAYKIISKEGVKEISLDKLYGYLFDAVERYQKKKKEAVGREEANRLDHIQKTIAAIQEREAQEENKDGIEDDLMSQLGDLESDLRVVG